MRAVAVHTDVIVVISAIWQTTCTAVRSGDEGFVIDSPVLPDELDALPSLLEQAGFPVSGLLCTHADWDHLLGRLACPEVSFGAGEGTARRLEASPGAAQRELRAFDEEHYVIRPRPLQLGGVQQLPVPGRLAVGDPAAGGGERELELHAAAGHTSDGTAFWIPWARTLVCGDYLSPVEIPMISAADGSADEYAATLKRLRPLVEQAETVVPGRGGPVSSGQALATLGEDTAYLEALARDGADAPLPASRRTSAQRRIHADNVARIRKT
jgi:glyoxylase-like metal-dependent hydrolase (beta-lactamase superfamily II)